LTNMEGEDGLMVNWGMGAGLGATPVLQRKAAPPRHASKPIPHRPKKTTAPPKPVASGSVVQAALGVDANGNNQNGKNDPAALTPHPVAPISESTTVNKKRKRDDMPETENTSVEARSAPVRVPRAPRSFILLFLSVLYHNVHVLFE
jgi:hypothetical protein